MSKATAILLFGSLALATGCNESQPSARTGPVGMVPVRRSEPSEPVGAPPASADPKAAELNRTLDRLAREVISPDPRTRRAAAQEAGSLGTDAVRLVPGLMSVVEGCHRPPPALYGPVDTPQKREWVAARIAAVEALGLIGFKADQASSSLLAALGDDDGKLRDAATRVVERVATARPWVVAELKRVQAASDDHNFRHTLEGVIARFEDRIRRQEKP